MCVHAASQKRDYANNINLDKTGERHYTTRAGEDEEVARESELLIRRTRKSFIFFPRSSLLCNNTTTTTTLRVRNDDASPCVCARAERKAARAWKNENALRVIAYNSAYTLRTTLMPQIGRFAKCGDGLISVNVMSERAREFVGLRIFVD